MVAKALLTAIVGTRRPVVVATSPIEGGKNTNAATSRATPAISSRADSASRTCTPDNKVAEGRVPRSHAQAVVAARTTDPRAVAIRNWIRAPVSAAGARSAAGSARTKTASCQASNPRPTAAGTARTSRNGTGAARVLWVPATAGVDPIP